MNETRTTKAKVKIIDTNGNLSAGLKTSGKATKKQALSDFGKRLLVLLNLTFQVAEDEPVQIAVHDVLYAAHFIACAVVLDLSLIHISQLQRRPIPALPAEIVAFDRQPVFSDDRQRGRP